MAKPAAAAALLGAAAGTLLAGCSTCPTGGCPPVCTVETMVPLASAALPGPAALAAGPGGLAAVYTMAGAGGRFSVLSFDGERRAEQDGGGFGTGVLAVFPLGAGWGVVTDAVPSLLLVHDATGAFLEERELALGVTTAAPGALAAVGDADGFALGYSVGGTGYLARFDGSGAPLGPPAAAPGADADGPVALARAPDGTLALAAAVAGGGIALRTSDGTADTLAALPWTLDPAGGAAVTWRDAPGGGFIVASSGDRTLGGVVWPGAAPLTFALTEGPVRPLLARDGGSGLVVLAWSEAGGDAFVVALGDDGAPRGLPAPLGATAAWFGLAATPNGTALLSAPITPTGETDLAVSLLRCR